MRIPIRMRLTAVYFSVFCVSTVLLEASAWISLQSAISAVVDRELVSRLAGVEDFLDEHVSRKTRGELQTELASHAALQPGYLTIDDPSIPVVQDRHVFQSASMAALEARPHRDGEIVVWTVSGEKPLRILAVRKRIRNRDLDIFLGTDLSVPFAVLRRFKLLLIFSSPLVLLCASAAGYWVSKRALDPVSEMAAATRSISAANLSQRIAVPSSGDELQALAEILNGMFERIEEAFRHMTQFTANASHELRTPIALMRTTAEVALLRVNGNADTYREALYGILRETEKSTNLLDDMLRLARADSHERILALHPVDPGPTIEEVCEGIAPLASEKHLHLTWEDRAGPVQVAADAAHLRRLWLILLDNAIKYTHTGTIHVLWRMGAPDSVICEIRDSGIGIAECDIPHIFERFYRADKARNRGENGAGLGLSIAKWIVDAHQASIEVESAPGKGSVFRVILPALPQTPFASLPPSASINDLVIQ